MKEIQANNMVLVIERQERYITAASNNLELEALKEELEKFIAEVSNPKDVQAYLDKWVDEDADIKEGLGWEDEEDEEKDDVEVVVSDDEDEEDEDDDDMADFVVRDDEGEDEANEQSDVEQCTTRTII